MRKVICSQATLNVSSSACIIWQGNLSLNTAKARDGGKWKPLPLYLDEMFLILSGSMAGLSLTQSPRALINITH